MHRFCRKYFLHDEHYVVVRIAEPATEPASVEGLWPSRTVTDKQKLEPELCDGMYFF